MLGEETVYFPVYFKNREALLQQAEMKKEADLINNGALDPENELLMQSEWVYHEEYRILEEFAGPRSAVKAVISRGRDYCAVHLNISGVAYCYNVPMSAKDFITNVLGEVYRGALAKN